MISTKIRFKQYSNTLGVISSPREVSGCPWRFLVWPKDTFYLESAHIYKQTSNISSIELFNWLKPVKVYKKSKNTFFDFRLIVEGVKPLINFFKVFY
jgi:hypothetical protein